jgi:hypothetical protein
VRPRLHHVRKPASWHQRAHDWPARSMAGYDGRQDVIRCEATTGSGAHEVPAEGRCPCGQRQEDPTRPQRTSLMGAWDPVGRPLSPEVGSGARADEGVDRPSIARIRHGWQTTGLVWGGAGQRRAWDTRASLARPQDWAVSPVPVPGAPAEARAAWIPVGGTPGEASACTRRGRTNDRGHAGRAAEGSAGARTCGGPDGTGAWRARVFVVPAPLHAHPQAAGLAHRRPHAEPHLAALTPPRGRGQRPLTDAAPLVEAIDRVRSAPRGDG